MSESLLSFALTLGQQADDAGLIQPPENGEALGRTLLIAVAAGLVASIACGLGVLPLAVRGIDPKKHTGIGYSVAGGLMLAASVFNLIIPALQDDLGVARWNLTAVLPVMGGVLLGAAFMVLSDKTLHRFGLHDHEGAASWGGRMGLLIFIAMTIHSIPEGVAVGVGYAKGNMDHSALGSYIALAIAIHNIPEGLAVGIPMRSAGTSIPRCFAAAFLTSLPQPIAAIPAVLAAWFFTPLMPVLLGFAAGAMIFLVVMELIPEALETISAERMAWAFTAGFCLMMLIQTVL